MHNLQLQQAIAALRTAQSIAVVGLSRTTGKPAHDIPLYMSKAGYRVAGINPTAVPEVDGLDVVGRIEDVPFRIDILNVFRPSATTDAIIDEAIHRNNLHGDVACVWLQMGITSIHGADKCAAAGITYIEDTCIYVVQQYVHL